MFVSNFTLVLEMMCLLESFWFIWSTRCQFDCD